MREANPGGHHPIENAGLHLKGEPLGIVRIECRVEPSMDRGKVNYIIFDSRVIPLHEERPSRQK
jgi:hypothetical protein